MYDEEHGLKAGYAYNHCAHFAGNDRHIDQHKIEFRSMG